MFLPNWAVTKTPCAAKHMFGHLDSSGYGLCSGGPSRDPERCVSVLLPNSAGFGRDLAYNSMLPCTWFPIKRL